MSTAAQERIERDIERIAGFSESAPELGYSRPSFSAAWQQALEYVVAEARDAGAECVVDAAGNVHLRQASVGWEQKVWLSGSHLDSVPSGGKYDGVTGVLVPLEILRRRPDLPLELVVFAEEEGTTFGLGMLGSRLWAGTLEPAVMERLYNRHGVSAAAAGAGHGLDLARLEAAGRQGSGGGADWTARLQPERYYGMIEVHPEQGLSLWDAGLPLAAVNRINGRRQLQVTVHGQANHAGSTGMQGRRDALAGAAEMLHALEALGRQLDRRLPYSVLTVGRLDVSPGAVNVIPGRVSFSVDMRAQEEEILVDGTQSIHELVQTIAEQRQLTVQIDQSEELRPQPLSAEICGLLQKAATAAGYELPLVPSGALHDSAVLAPFLPTAMLFVASRDGISHNPAEYSRVEDIALAAQLLEDMISQELHP